MTTIQEKNINKICITAAVCAGFVGTGLFLSSHAADETTAPETNEQTAGYGDAESANSSGTQSSTVLYTKSSNYTVTIPKTITLGSDKTGSYTVNVKGDIASDKQINVTVPAKVTMVDKLTTGAGKKADVDATITHNKTVWSYTELAVVQDVEGVSTNVGTTSNNSIEALGLTAGQWEGTLTFTIGMGAVGAAPTTPAE